MMRESTDEIEVSVVMPCLNEERTVGICIEKAFAALSRANIRGEIIVCDNGSTDNSAEVASKAGARVIFQPDRGYGNAYMKGISEVRGKYIVVGDSDNTYDFGEIDRFITPLKNGYDFVIGNRFRGQIKRGAMPFLHKYIGNPLLSIILKIMFKARISDPHCGMRSFTAEAYSKMHLITAGMEYASEMVINAVKAGLKIKEIPITLHNREGESKLRSFPDGWRHLRFMLLYSPNHLFLIPGLLFFIIGSILLIGLLFGPVKIGGRFHDVHLMMIGGLLNIIGVQIIGLGLLAKAYSFTEKFERRDKLIEFFYKYFTLERGLAVGISALIVGSLCMFAVIYKWVASKFGPLDEVRMVFFSLVIIVNSLQIIFHSFLLSIMSIKHRRK